MIGPARLLPDGQCWCDCGQEAARGQFFALGHNRIAERLLAVLDGRELAQRLAEAGYIPGQRSLTDAAFGCTAGLDPLWG